MAKETAKKPAAGKQAKNQRGGRPSLPGTGVVLAEGKPAPLPKGYKARIQELYSSKVLPQLMKELGVKSPMQAPKLLKIVINVGVTEAKENIQALDLVKEDLALITGQCPQVRRAKKSISNFKLREGMPIGVRVTLRGTRMYEFLDRFVSLAVPRIRDFQGFDPKFFDGRGNLNIGLKEHHIFPEINMERSPKAHGMNLSFVTDAGDNQKGKMLLEELGIPFKKAK
ncbi:MAG: 50S ribosomal protein L5 [Elusimicrobiales bacterium]|nr:50S ribosomal protein L5 [Elusimicrobiales bacterium]